MKHKVKMLREDEPFSHERTSWEASVGLATLLIGASVMILIGFIIFVGHALIEDVVPLIK